VRLAVDLDRIRAPTIQHRTAAVRLETAASPQIGAGLGFTWNLCDFGLAAVARYATATASFGSLTAATLDDVAAAVGDRSAFAAIASLFAAIAHVRVDASATATPVVGLVATPAICATAAASHPIVELVARVHDLGRAGAGDGKPRDQSKRGTSQTKTRTHSSPLVWPGAIARRTLINRF